MSGDGAQLRARPLGANLIWVRVASPASSVIPRMLAMSRDPEKISVMDHVQKQWMQRRICFKHEDQEPIREEEAPRGRGRPKPSCLDAKRCLRGEAGDAVW